MKHEHPVLRVVLNGSFAFFTNFEPDDDPAPGQTVEAHIPHMGTEHVYRAGDFLAETEIEEGIRLRLTGVDPGPGYFNERENLLVCAPDSSAEGRARRRVKATTPAFGRGYATLVFPRPHKISSGLLCYISGIQPPDSNRPTQLATIQVFDYFSFNNEDLSLGSHPWPLPYRHKKRPEKYRLYVYATAEVGNATAEQPNGIPPDHGSRAFNSGMSLFEAAKFYLPPESDPSTRMPMSCATPHLHPPLSWLERLDLWERTLFLAKLGSMFEFEPDLFNPASLRDVIPEPSLLDIQPGCGASGVGK